MISDQLHRYFPSLLIYHCTSVIQFIRTEDEYVIVFPSCLPVINPCYFTKIDNTKRKWAKEKKNERETKKKPKSDNTESDIQISGQWILEKLL